MQVSFAQLKCSWGEKRKDSYYCMYESELDPSRSDGT